MRVVTEIAEVRDVRASMAEPYGLVPTMGFLHEGHLSLVRQARVECESVAVSIYVNPTQFGPSEDLEAYPSDLEQDLRMLESEGVDLVWTPTTEVIYPSGFQTWVTVNEISKHLEGTQRLGHFRGVATVVAKLFNVFQPQRAYFGQKDAQQMVLIRRMAVDLNFPIEVIACPTVREEDGLAMSSRNSYLNTEERKAATVLFRALTIASEAFKEGELDAGELRSLMSETITSEPLAQEQYVSVADPNTLEELQGKVQRALLSMAVYVGDTRLIDNVVVGEESK
ncbi:MAG: pantoate--beta-alanine ligase [Anaerolineales bacterium]|nr:pantoate--beta-alanine ligase [Anaerolineales bacterium]